MRTLSGLWGQDTVFTFGPTLGAQCSGSTHELAFTSGDWFTAVLLYEGLWAHPCLWKSAVFRKTKMCDSVSPARCRTAVREEPASRPLILARRALA